MSSATKRGPDGYVFAVADSLFCCWEHDHVERNLEFLRGLDSDHYWTLACILGEAMGDNVTKMSASIALRASYQQGIESLMSLLGALAQPPEYVPAWIAKCRTEDLREVVSRLRTGSAMLTQEGNARITFDDLAARCLQYAWVNDSDPTSTGRQFATLWRRLSPELLDDTTSAEYNAIKHGMRVSPGGFTLSIGVEDTPGVPVPPEATRSLGGSEYRSTFFRAEQVGTTSWNFRARRVSLNWSADAITRRLMLISMSIKNVVAALQCEMGIDPRAVEFTRPTPLSAFDDAWSPVPGMTVSGFDSMIRLDPGDEPTRAELRARLESGRPPTSEEPADRSTSVI